MFHSMSCPRNCSGSKPDAKAPLGRQRPIHGSAAYSLCQRAADLVDQPALSLPAAGGFGYLITDGGTQRRKIDTLLKFRSISSLRRIGQALHGEPGGGEIPPKRDDKDCEDEGDQLFHSAGNFTSLAWTCCIESIENLRSAKRQPAAVRTSLSS